MAADGGDVAEPLTSGPVGGRPTSWTGDGRVLAFFGNGIWTLGVNRATIPGG
jgi:hypothetical protein